MKQRKVAVSLAVVGAIAAPFVFRTYKAEPYVDGFRALAAERREDITAYLARLNNCREFETIPIGSIPDEGMRCFERKALLQNGEYYSHFSAPKYLGLNAAAMAGGFVIVFGLTYLLSAIARRYWRWLNT